MRVGERIGRGGIWSRLELLVLGFVGSGFRYGENVSGYKWIGCRGRGKYGYG